MEQCERADIMIQHKQKTSAFCLKILSKAFVRLAMETKERRPIEVASRSRSVFNLLCKPSGILLPFLWKTSKKRIVKQKNLLPWEGHYFYKNTWKNFGSIIVNTHIAEEKMDRLKTTRIK